MYGGYESGVLGWKDRDDGITEEQQEIVAYFKGFIHHWAAHFERTAFIDDVANGVNIHIRESGKMLFCSYGDIINGMIDARKVVVGLSGRTDLPNVNFD
jgi:hypothetical protein